MMTKAQINTFNKLLESADFKGKKQLRYLLWLNTEPPKFAVGDCFKVSKAGHLVFGHKLKDFKARVVEVKTFLNECEWLYSLEFVARCGDKETHGTVLLSESSLTAAERCEGFENILPEARSKHAEQIEVNLF